MADDTRDSNQNGTASTVVDSGAPPKKLRRGVVLGKDGKPCRSCNSFVDFTSQTKTITKSTIGHSLVATGPPLACPPDVEELGRSSWTLLHSITASYPISPTLTEQSQVRQFMGLFSKLYPCWVCAEDFQDFMAKNRVRAESREEFGQWMCEAHNDVNRKLGKKEFDCSKWEERWRTGWKDGRCD
ncbi:mitochondrial FAD-linked sulfhydryl oxidase-like protein ERV1 [Hyaloscypha bicolor E]|uniref:Sulfhydryl oxidase n=1 Tax=Hyaloscypha bicolor E TaxID=1095630 RepID=A0A2J6TVZ0_9HELO|nr:mitochondrial FAD-linked sulfhydryl oxidase-like protein ERV1 [Hyaloscypha bicolor E]PMD67118.1 mitochondrial FAD-linked sulfhydryl oxidase-like protein ERV1 [Hyaloscypha bicolor E]